MSEQEVEVRIDRDAEVGVEVTVRIVAQHHASREAVEVAIADAVRRTLRSLEFENIPDHL